VLAFILRRLIQAVFTIFGVMLLTFILFRAIPGDVSARYVNPKLGKAARDAWMERHRMNLPLVLNTAVHVQFWKPEFWNTQFFWHLRQSLTFEARSFKTDEKLTKIVAERAKYSLALTVPAMALGWLLALVVACVVAYFRGSWFDYLMTFLAVLGMCVPYLAYMIGVQWFMFNVKPTAAWGLRYPTNIYVPVAIAVIAGVGASVRFYRTVILDEVNRDYVRTAMAKGVPLPGVLFRHVLRNCMLPILTSLVTAIPFLIIGSLLLEQFFGIPGLGPLMLGSINDRDIPIVTNLTFLTAALYTLGLLLTDVLYAVFDPRIRLR
jgi:peptide/nickel transport system permease protein